MKILKKYLVENKITYKSDIAYFRISRKNNNKIISYFIQPNEIMQFKNLIKFCLDENIKFLVVGGLWNTYISENSKINILISTIRLNKYKLFDKLLICEPGVLLKKLSEVSIANNVNGFVCFSGIPGTAAGSVVTNAGALSSEMSRVVKSIKYIDLEGVEREINNIDLGFKLRNSNFKNGILKGYIFEVVFNFDNFKPKENLEKDLINYDKHRLKYVDGKNNSLGSVFVSTTLNNALKKYQKRFFIKTIIFRLLCLVIRDNFKRQKINCRLIFLFLGNYKMSRHCDTINRFIWTTKTKEEDYLNYIKFIKKISNNEVVLENQIF